MFCVSQACYQTELAGVQKEKESQREEFLKKLDDIGAERQELKSELEKLALLSAEADGLRAEKMGKKTRLEWRKINLIIHHISCLYFEIQGNKTDDVG